MKPVLVTTSSFCAADKAPREALTKAGLSVHENPHRRKLTEDEAIELLSQHKPVGMIAGVEPLTARVLQSAAGHLKVVSRCGVGLDSVDMSAAEKLGMLVKNTPDAPAPAVAELAITLMLAALRRVNQADAGIRRGEWKPLMGGLLGARTVGLIGIGRIGAQVASIVRGFGARVLAYDPRQDLPAIPGVERSGFDDVVARSEILSLHLPMSPENRHLMNAARIAQMPRGAILINVSRGGLVDEEALAAALKSGALSGAGLDVFESEPYKGPLKDLPQAVLTAHMGAAAEECRTRMEREAAQNLIAGLKSTGVL